MSPFLADVPVEAVLGITLPLLIGGAVAITALVTGHFRKTQRDDMEATLKMEMIQRGMSPAEIERVLLAKGESSPSLAKQLGRAAGELARNVVN